MDTIAILVVEDNPGDARLIEEYLNMDKSVNFSVNFTTTLIESLKVLSDKKFDVVLVDLGLPDSQGIYTFHEIKNINPKSPIIIITGNDDEDLGLEAIKNGAQNYLVKNQINSTLLVRTIKYAIEIKRKNVELNESQEKYRSIFEGAASLIVTVSCNGVILNCNNRIEQLLGYNKDEIIGQPVNMIIHPDSLEKAEKSIEEVFEKGILYTGEYKMTKKDGEVIFANIHSSALKDENNKIVKVSCIIDDITKRILFEKEQVFTTKVLSILNRANEWHKLIHDILVEIMEFSEIEAVGIRHKEGEDYPYFEAIGFPDSFIRKENFLCARNEKGELKYDSDGKPFLECMCGNIISKRTDSSYSFYTETGSFWTNSTTNLLANTTDKERLTYTRNHCNAAGYESVALIPLISENKTIGLLQLNDKRKNMFTEEIIHFYEGIGLTIGIAFKRIQAEKLIKDSEEQYRRLFECARDGILILDADTGRILDANPYLTENLGYSHAEFLSKRLWEIGPFKDIIPSKEGFEKLQMEEFIRYDDMPLETKNGKKFFVEFISNVYLIKDKKVIQCNIRNITERKKFEKELVAAKEKAEESDKLKSAFLANISHEIRTPLNGILGFTDLLSPGLPVDKQQEYIDIIMMSGEQLLKIIGDILEISKIETRQVIVEDTQFNLNQFVHEVYLFYSELYRVKKPEINFIVNISNEIKDTIIIADRLKLKQIVSNLLENAFKFTSKGDITLNCSIYDNNIEFNVKDTGIGIPENSQEIIFEHFRQADNDISQLYGGTGLGLAICKNLVELMGGKITVQSKFGHGSEFRFTIPVKYPDKTATVKKHIKVEENYDFKGIEILIAEDDKINFFLLQEYLKETKCTLYHAKNGSEVYGLLLEHPGIKLILMDIKMPVMNGIEAFKQIKDKKTDVYVIAQTAYTFDYDEAQLLSMGFNDYISKPIDYSTFLRKINKFVKKEITVNNFN